MVRKSFFTVISLLILFALQSSAQTVDEIIEKNLEARGGLEKIKAVKSLRMTGRMVAQGQDMPFSVQMERPSKVRVEFTMQGKSAIQAYDGKTGWMVMPFLGSDEPKELVAEDLKDIEEQADIDGPLVDYKTKGNIVEFVGKEAVEGKEAYHLKLTLKNGNIRSIYIDTKTNLEIKTSSTQKRQGQEFEVDAYLKNYRSVDGLMFPYAVDQKVADRGVSSFTLDKVETDIELDDSIFKMPEEEPQTQTAPLEEETL